MYATSKKIGELEIKNRFVRSATGEGIAINGGYVTEKLIDLYKSLAEGGVGLIITGNAIIHPSGISVEHMMGISNDDFIPGLTKIADIVHKSDEECKVCIQINHCGRQSNHLKDPIAPSAVFDRFTNKMPREMTNEEIEEIIEAFAQAIRRAKDAGFDAVQLHSAHGYLLSEFLSPFTNKRVDDYGGSIENRIRIFKEIYNRGRELVPKNFPILIKMNGSDFLKDGLEIEESKIFAVKLSKIGYDAIEISGGMWEAVFSSKEELGWNPRLLTESRIKVGKRNEVAYNLPYAKELKSVTDVPLILVGGINSLELAQQILNDGNADFVSFCRPFIREPDFPNKWLKGIGNGTVECIYCNSCISSIVAGGIRCINKEKQLQKRKR
jgi:2,4-dienoyl-CoA reductase-like NADH-dependent reductase (Old Yellow Enzyme family)